MDSISNIAEIRKAVTRVLSEVKKQEIWLIKKSATDMHIEIQQNIMSEKFATASWEYSDSYKAQKDDKHPNKPYWKYSDDLFNSISNTVTTGINRFVGIPSDAMNSKGESIPKYALMMEFGGKRFKARPVFGPSLNEYFDGKFQLRVSHTVAEILSKWG